MKILLTLFSIAIASSAPAFAAQNSPPVTVKPIETPTEPPGYFERARELTAHALALIGVHYKWGGDTPEQGLDCSGLVTHVFEEVAGVELPRTSQSMSKVGEKVDKDELQPGDLVFFNTRRSPYSHVGIYIGDERFVHAPRRGSLVRVSNLEGRYWKKHFNGGRRVAF